MAFVFLILIFFIDQRGVSDKHSLLSFFSLILQPLSQCEWLLSASATGPCFCYTACVSDSCQPVWLVLDPPATQPVWVTPVSQCNWSLFLLLSLCEWLLSASVTGHWSSSHSASVSDSCQPVWLVLVSATQPVWMTPFSQCDWSLILKSLSQGGDSCQPVWLILVSATQPVWVTPVSQCDWSLILQPLSQCEWLLSASVTGPCFCYSSSVSDSCQPVWLVLDPPTTQPVWVTPVSQCDWSLFLLLSQCEWLLSASVTCPCFCYSDSVSDSSQSVWLVLDPPATQPVWVTPVSQCDWSLFLLLSQCERLQSVSVSGPWSSSHSASVSDSCQPVQLVLVSATQPGWVTPVSQCDWSLILQSLSQCEWLLSASVIGPCFCYSACVSDSSQSVWLVLDPPATQPVWVTPVTQCDWSLFLLLSLCEWLLSAGVTGPWSSSHSASVSDSSQPVRLVLVSATQPVWVTPVSQCDWSLILQPLSQCEWLQSASATGPCFCYSSCVSDSSQPVWLVLDPPATQPVWVTPVSQCDWFLFLVLSLCEWLLSASVTGPCFCCSASVSDSCQPDWSLILQQLSWCE